MLTTTPKKEEKKKVKECGNKLKMWLRKRMKRNVDKKRQKQKKKNEKIHCGIINLILCS